MNTFIAAACWALVQIGFAMYHDDWEKRIHCAWMLIAFGAWRWLSEKYTFRLPWNKK